MYQVTDGAFHLEGVGRYHSCGLKLPSGVMITDITMERSSLNEFAECLNRLEASEIHIWELVDDFLCK